MKDISLLSWQTPLHFYQAGTQAAALPARLRAVSRISIRLSCSTGEVCDEVEINIMGCVQGNAMADISWHETKDMSMITFVCI